MIKLEEPPFKGILEECGGNEELLEEQLDRLRLWLKQQLHLPQDISEKRLKFYIYTAKFDLERAKRRLDLHYTIRNLIPECYSSFDPLAECVTRALKNIRWVMLPKLTPTNCRVNIYKFLRTENFIFDVLETMRYINLQIETRLEEDTVNSDIYVFDCTNLTLTHVLQHTPPVLKKVDLILESYGLRIKGVHMINAPSYIDVLVTLIKSAMKAKLFNRVSTYSSGMESLHHIIPKSILPADYGGEEPSLDTLTDMWQAKLLERREWLLQQGKINVNESLRSNSVINPDDLFGIPGTFRKLNVD